MHARAGYQHLIADLEGSSLYGAISVDSKGGRVYQNQLVEPHVSRLAAVSTFYLDAGSDNIFRFSDQVDAPAISSLIGKISEVHRRFHYEFDRNS
jgi:hypothetical protein